MPCNCDHLEPRWDESESVKVLELLREARGESYNHKNPRHLPYGNPKTLDAETSALCALLKEHGLKPSASLELQIWWRDHQEADRAREAREAAAHAAAVARAAALSKLTPEERRTLALEREGP